MKKKLLSLLGVLCFAYAGHSQVEYNTSNFPYSRFVKISIDIMKEKSCKPLTFDFSLEENRYGRIISPNLSDLIVDYMRENSKVIDNVYSFEVEVYCNEDVEKETLLKYRERINKDIANLFFVMNSKVSLLRMRYIGVRFLGKLKDKEYPYEGRLTVSKLCVSPEKFDEMYELSMTERQDIWKVYKLNTDRTSLEPYIDQPVIKIRRRD